MQDAGHALQDGSSNPPPNDNDTYRIMVLRYDQTEEEIDRQYLQTALNLGINVPQSPKTTLDLVTHTVSTLDINLSAPEPSIQPSSRTSASTHAASDSSAEHPGYLKSPSLTAASITSAPSTSSTSSQRSSYVRIRKRLRRISTLRRRKTLGTLAPDIPLPLSNSRTSRPALQLRAATTDYVPTSVQLRPLALAINETQMGTPRTTRRRQVASSTYTPAVYYTHFNHSTPAHRSSHVPQVPHSTPEPEIRPSSEPRYLSAEVDEAVKRSLNHPTLKKLRTTQLQEQLRFISFQASQNRLMRTAHLQAKRNALIAYKARQANLEDAHADALTSLEHRHLSAEVDLRKGLEAEKRACDTRLKHMQAYCNPRSNVEGMPRREVTRADYQQLEQQYHLRNTMDNLHASRINVLREKQARQLERIVAKQEAEMENVERGFDGENAALDVRFQAEEVLLTDEFSARRGRLVRRWDLAEQIERRKLQLETGDDFGQLPAVEWRKEEEDEYMSSSPNKTRFSGLDGDDAEAIASDDGVEEEDQTAYNSMNMI